MSKQYEQAIRQSKSVASAVIGCGLRLALVLALVGNVAISTQAAQADNNEILGATVKGVEIPVLEVCDTGNPIVSGRAKSADKTSLDASQVKEASLINRAVERNHRAG